MVCLQSYGYVHLDECIVHLCVYDVKNSDQYDKCSFDCIVFLLL